MRPHESAGGRELRVEALLALATLALAVLAPSAGRAATTDATTDASAASPARAQSAPLALRDAIGGPVGSVARGGDGRVYATRGLHLMAVDVSDPDAPRDLPRAWRLPSLARDLALAGDVAYVAHAAGLQPVDLRAERLTADSVRTPLDGALAVDAAGGHAYVLLDSLSPMGYEVFDLADPLRPEPVDELDWARELRGRDLLARDGALYVRGHDGLRVASLADPARPLPVGDPLPLARQGPGELGASLLALRDELLAVAGGGELALFDVSEPLAPRRVGSLAPEGGARAVSLRGPGRLALAGADRLSRVDVSAPSAPLLLDGLALPSEGRGLAALDGDRVALGAGAQGLRLADLPEDGAARARGALATFGEALGVATVADAAFVAAGPQGLAALRRGPDGALALDGLLEGPAEAQLVAAGAGRVYGLQVSDDETEAGRMWAYEAASGAPLGEAALPGRPLAAEAMGEGPLLALSAEGRGWLALADLGPAEDWPASAPEAGWAPASLAAGEAAAFVQDESGEIRAVSPGPDDSLTFRGRRSLTAPSYSRGLALEGTTLHAVAGEAEAWATPAARGAPSQLAQSALALPELAPLPPPPPPPFESLVALDVSDPDRLSVTRRGPSEAWMRGLAISEGRLVGASSFASYYTSAVLAYEGGTVAQQLSMPHTLRDVAALDELVLVAAGEAGLLVLGPESTAPTPSATASPSPGPSATTTPTPGVSPTPAVEGFACYLPALRR